MAKQQIEQARNWYVIHTYQGYEDQVAKQLRQRIKSLSMEDEIFQSLTTCARLTDGISGTLDALNILLDEAASEGLYVSISKEEKHVSGKVMQTKFTLHQSSYTVVFARDANKPGG